MTSATAQPPLAIIEHRDAVLHPLDLQPPTHMDDDVAGGVLDADGRLVPESLVRRHDRTIPLPPDPKVPAEASLSGEFLYAGFLIPHFGHFITESLARAWAAKKRPDLPLLWAGTGPLLKWQAEMLDLLGLRERSRFAEVPTRVERLLVPEVGFRLADLFHPDQEAALACVPAPPPSSGPKPFIWLSRSKFAQSWRGAVDGEKRLDDALSARGWEIRHPQELPMAQQAQLFQRAEVIAGMEGSAQHSLLLAERPLAPIISLRISRGRDYSLIADARGIPRYDLRRQFEHDDMQIGVKDQVLRDPEATAARMDEMARRIARIRRVKGEAAVLRDSATYLRRHELAVSYARHREKGGTLSALNQLRRERGFTLRRLKRRLTGSAGP